LQWVGPKVYVMMFHPTLVLAPELIYRGSSCLYRPHCFLDDPFKEPSPAPSTNPPDSLQPSFPPVHKETIDAIWMSVFLLPGMEESSVS